MWTVFTKTATSGRSQFWKPFSSSVSSAMLRQPCALHVKSLEELKCTAVSMNGRWVVHFESYKSTCFQRIYFWNFLLHLILKLGAIARANGRRSIKIVIRIWFFLMKKHLLLFVCLFWCQFRLCDLYIFAFSELLSSCRAKLRSLPPLRCLSWTPVRFIRSWHTSSIILSRISGCLFHSSRQSVVCFAMEPAIVCTFGA